MRGNEDDKYKEFDDKIKNVTDHHEALNAMIAGRFHFENKPSVHEEKKYKRLFNKAKKNKLKS